MKQPILLVMAAGMGSRFGGLKQLAPVGAHGEVIMDYSLYDAHRAGFERVIFVIKHTIEEEFKAKISPAAAAFSEVLYAFQDVDDLPEGYTAPAGRERPWGTAHAILAARDLIDAPFAVINADDYYGPEGFHLIYDYLSGTAAAKCRAQDSCREPAQGIYPFCMVAYRLKNTVTAHGTVSRGVCAVHADGTLKCVIEHTGIRQYEDGIRGIPDEAAKAAASGKKDLDPESLVSMNLWGFTPDFVREGWARFPAVLDRLLAENPQKGEYYLPSVVTALINEGKARVQVLQSADKWHGVTYKEDQPAVEKALAAMTAEGLYPVSLWN